MQRAVLVLAVLLLSCGPSTKPTEVFVTLDAEPGYEAAADKLVVEVRGGEGSDPRSYELAKMLESSLSFPATLVLAPRDGKVSRGWWVEARLESGGEVLASVRAFGRYVKNRKVDVSLLFESACQGVFCDARSTCRAGQCVSADVEAGAESDAGAGVGDSGSPMEDSGVINTVCKTALDCDDDGVFCNGTPRCDPSDEAAAADGCVKADTTPCLTGQACDEDTDRCVTDCSLSRDADGDGVDASECGGTDCDDADKLRFPGQAEVCDADDEDCDSSTVGARDLDSDGFVSDTCCNLTDDSKASCGNDCEDDEPSVNPGADERCNGVDDDCSGDMDDEPAASAACPNRDHATGVCTDGKCGLECEPDFGDCNESPGDGCEATLTVSARHCGTCGKACAALDVCEEASCKPYVGTKATAIAAGRDHTCAILESGAVSCWGENLPGDRAIDPTSFADEFRLPHTVPDVSDVDLISAGGSVVYGNAFTCARSDGNVRCWGDLGDGPDGFFTVGNLSSPAAITAGGSHACAIGSDGKPYCWGFDRVAQLGDGAWTLNSGNFTTSASAVVGSLGAVTSLGAGADESCAVTSSGALYCWGYNEVLCSGGYETSIATPAQLVLPGQPSVQYVSTGSSLSCARTAEAAYCWGGSGTWRKPGMAQVVPELATLIDLTVGTAAACGVGQAGKVRCWGFNSELLGPVGEDPVVRDIDVLGVVDVTLGRAHACALTQAGRVLCWGGNDAGQLGDGSTESRLAPRVVPIP